MRAGRSRSERNTSRGEGNGGRRRASPRRAPSAPGSTLNLLSDQMDIEASQVPLDPELARNGRQRLRDLSDGQEVTGAFCVRERELRQKRNGEDFLRLILADSTGTVEAVAWEEATERFEVAEPGSVVFVGGRYSVHSQYGPKITIESIRPARDGEFDPEEIAEGPEIPVERLGSD